MTRLLGALAVLALLLSACGSDEDDFRDQLKALDPTITDETVDCIIDELDKVGLDVGDISDEAIGDGPIPEGGEAALSTCLFASADLPVDPAADDSSTDSGDSGSTDSAVVDTYGSDPALDALWDACENGSGIACDDLYFQSPVGSDYEDFGNTCGRRFETSPGFCEEEI